MFLKKGQKRPSGSSDQSCHTDCSVSVELWKQIDFNKALPVFTCSFTLLVISLSVPRPPTVCAAWHLPLGQAPLT